MDIDEFWASVEKNGHGSGISPADSRIKELEDILNFLVANDSINDSSIEKEVIALLKSK